MSGSGEEDILRRWSARKRASRADAAPRPAAPAAPPAGPPAGPPADASPEKTDAEILHELGLPDPASLAKDDDFKAFLQAGIPARLRARALRQLWLTDPVLANLDGLNDYDQDFTDSATVRPDIRTVYRVGRGLLGETPRPDAAAGARVAPDDPGDRAGDDELPAGATEWAAADAPQDGMAAADASPGPETGPEAATSPAGDPGDQPVEAAPVDRPRPAARMRFRFGTG